MPAGETGQLTSIRVPGVRARTSSVGVCVEAKLYTNSSKSTLLQTSSNSVCDIDSSGGEFGGAEATGSFEFGNIVSLSSGTQYFFELSQTSGSTEFWTSQSYVSPGGGYSGGQLFVNAGFVANYDMAFTLTYSSADTTAPTFTSASSFSAAENIATSATAATIRVSESATVTISSGVDAARFNISRSETNTAIIKFNVSPDFEAPADVGGNNVYELTLTATDAAANAGTQSITITVTDVVDTSSFNSLALAGSATTATFRTAVAITADITVASRVTFRVNGKVLPGCKNRLASGSGSNYSVTCSWKPSNRGAISLTATATPTGAGISSASSNPVSVMVANRTGSR
jgi:serralysin